MARDSIDNPQRDEIKPFHGVVVPLPFAYGQQLNRAFDPFALYRVWANSRDTVFPPHLVFANLKRDEGHSSLTAFLHTYGSPNRPIPVEKSEMTDIFGADWRGRVEELRTGIIAPSAVWMSTLHRLPILPNVLGVNESTWSKIDVEEFWRDQRQFSDLYCKWAATRNSRTDEIRPDQISEAERILARELDRRMVKPVKPRVLLGPGGLCSSWRCDSLLDAMYLMFFLDIWHCHGSFKICKFAMCDVVFSNAKPNVRYCSLNCERKASHYDWYHAKGKEYRARKKEKQMV